MHNQAVAAHRCASCERWGGWRRPGANPESVVIVNETSTGLCLGGPWNGQERRARSACGHWTIWPGITPSVADD